MEDDKKIKAYQETCNSIRHYSTCGYNARALVIVQSLVLTSGWLFIFDKASLLLLTIIPIFGILLTLLLSSFYHGYRIATAHFYKIAAEIENSLFDDTFRPMENYKIKHEEMYKNFFKRNFILYAPFSLTYILFAIAFIITICSKLLCDI